MAPKLIILVKSGSGRDYQHSLAMQKLLKNEIGSIDVFLLLFSGAATRSVSNLNPRDLGSNPDFVLHDGLI